MKLAGYEIRRPFMPKTGDSLIVRAGKYIILGPSMIWVKPGVHCLCVTTQYPLKVWLLSARWPFVYRLDIQKPNDITYRGDAPVNGFTIRQTPKPH